MWEIETQKSDLNGCGSDVDNYLYVFGVQIQTEENF